MELLNSIILPRLPLPTLRKVSDLLYFDGPLLSHFVSDKYDNYLYYWVEVDENFNRWLIFRVAFEDLEAYYQKKKTLQELILNPTDSCLYSVDIDDNLQYHNIGMVYPQELPASYVPAQDSLYFGEPYSENFDIYSYSQKYNAGILQTYYKNSSKVGYGTIDLSVLAPSLFAFQLLSDGLGKSFVKIKHEKNLEIDEKIRPKFNKLEYQPITSYEMVGITHGSFGMLFRKKDRQTSIPNTLTLSDEFTKYVMQFIEASFDYDHLKEFVRQVDIKSINKYQDLLKSIIHFKLQFNLHWANAISNQEYKQKINFKQADEILRIFEKIDFENSEDIKITGRFIALNLKLGSYSFQSIDDDVHSTGHLDKDRQEMAYMIAFNKTYDVIIKRKETKLAGKKKPNIDDMLVSFVEINTLNNE